MTTQILTPAKQPGKIFLTDAGLETDLIFNHDIELPEFAAHTLLSNEHGRQKLMDYLQGYLKLAIDHGFGFILDSQTWRAQSHFAEALKTNDRELEKINKEAIQFISQIRQRHTNHAIPIILNAVIGPKGDGYQAQQLTAEDAQNYHAKQIAWLAQTDVEMITGLTLTSPEEAIGIAKAAREFNLPAVISFTVETDGKLPNGLSLQQAIAQVDNATTAYPSYYMVNCAHPDHFSNILHGEWTRRIGGIRCNASRCSHAELDECTVLDDGDPNEFGTLYQTLARRLPWVNVFGGCCGSDLRHVSEVAAQLAVHKPLSRCATR